MKTICVGGTSSHCGKTALACLLLTALPGWAAVKVTTCRLDEACPRGDDCGACGAPESGYEVVTDRERLMLAGKDTARFIEAGTGPVVWLRALPEFLAEGLESALAQVAGAPGVVVESTTAIRYLGGLHIMVTQTGASDPKESARRCAGLIDLVAVNLRPEQVGSARQARVQTGVPTIPVCAVLSKDHAVNRRFLARVARELRQEFNREIAKTAKA